MTGRARALQLLPGRHDSADGRRPMLARLCVVVVVMFGFGYALVPFYEKICEVTGMRDVARPDEVRNTQVDTTRSVRIELDSNVRKLPWEFRPQQPIVGAHPGELVQVSYEIVNATDRDLTGQAIPSYGPPEAARYFRKLECFCFTKQTLKAGERRVMPVVFVVDPELPRDIPAITLSYTFFEVEGHAKN